MPMTMRRGAGVDHRGSGLRRGPVSTRISSRPCGDGVVQRARQLEEANDELARLLRFSVDDLVSRSMFDLTHAEDLLAARSAFGPMRGASGSVTRQRIGNRHDGVLWSCGCARSV